MPRLHTPVTGPLAGQRCRVLDDGSLEPLPEMDTRAIPPAVVVPEVFGDERSTNAWKRGSISSMQGQMVQHGVESNEARTYATIAARRRDGEHIPYPSSSRRA